MDRCARCFLFYSFILFHSIEVGRKTLHPFPLFDFLFALFHIIFHAIKLFWDFPRVVIFTYDKFLHKYIISHLTFKRLIQKVLNDIEEDSSITKII